METFDVRKSIEAQKQLCAEKHYPDFSPRDGVCWNCREQIYAIKYWKGFNGNGKRIPGTEADHTSSSGISTEDASHHVTGCPHCYRSYCD